ncbi:MAG: PAS domain S-box protein [Candidatus Aminicenantes bacterium]|nr:PAS domain S-box protein [Candidatus Aminicenantes bacterium]
MSPKSIVRTAIPDPPLRILFVEDNPNDAEMAKREILREITDFRDVLVDTEKEFRHALDDFNPHLIVSDYAMPAFNGMLALEIARSRPDRIPFIMLTGSINEETAVACLKSGADDYVLKERIKRLPFAIREALSIHAEQLKNERALEQLRQSEEKFRLIAENSIDCIWQLDKDFRFTFLSPSLHKILGFKPEEWIGTCIFDHEAEKNDEVGHQIAREMLENPQTFTTVSFETEMLHKDGRMVPLEIMGKPLFRSGKLAGIQGSTRDISERRQAEVALRENEKRFRELADMLPVVIFETDRRGRINYANHQAVDLFKYPLEDLVTELNIFDMIAPEERDLARDTFSRRLTGESFGMINYRGITKNGKTFPMLVKMSPILADEVIAGFRGIVIDTSKDQEMIEKLSASQKRFQVLFEYAPDSFFLIDTQGKIIEANRQALQMLQLQLADLVGKSLVSSFHLQGPDKKRWQNLLARNSKGLPTEMEEFSVKLPERSRTVIEISTYPAQIGSEALILAIARDITHFRQLQEELENHRKSLERLVKARTRELNKALRDSETNRDRIDTILKSVSDGLMVTDVNGYIILMNTRAEEYLNLHFAECINRKIGDVLYQASLIKLIGNAFTESKAVRTDVEVMIKAGVAHVLEAVAKPISVKKKKPIGILTTLRDVTHSREIERMKTEFLSTTAHELRTPLTSIQGFSEILLTRKNLKADEKERFLSYINRQSMNLSGIISDLLDISRIESGEGFKLNISPVNLNEIIAKRIELFRISHGEHTFITNFRAADRPVFADQEKIDQVMQNLLSNAVKYSPNGGEISVKTNIKDAEFQVAVKDCGIGMSKDQVRNIFRKFYRADSSDTAPAGTGLGMSIVKLIIEKHKGRIHVESRPGMGTKVVFAIPIQSNPENGAHIQGEDQP